MKRNVWKSADRRQFIGGSDARIIMGTNEIALVRLWKEKRGEIEPEDLSDNLIVQLGLATETLKVQWTGEFLLAVGWLVFGLSLGAIWLLYFLIRHQVFNPVLPMRQTWPLFLPV